MRIIIATIKSWNIKKAEIMRETHLNANIDVRIIHTKEQLEFDLLQEYDPDYVFFPHWSWIIPEKIYLNFNCIVFHMSDLPFGRGGSPLQNLIANGYMRTKISAIKVQKGLDTGDIYVKEELTLEGNAQEIFVRASNIIFTKMIPFIIGNKPIPYKQEGDIVEFSRRRPEDGEILSCFSTEKIFDYIRMLDAEGYPNAYIKFGQYTLKFSQAAFTDNKINAKVEIIQEKSEV